MCSWTSNIFFQKYQYSQMIFWYDSGGYVLAVSDKSMFQCVTWTKLEVHCGVVLNGGNNTVFHLFPYSYWSKLEVSNFFMARPILEFFLILVTYKSQYILRTVFFCFIDVHYLRENC